MNHSIHRFKVVFAARPSACRTSSGSLIARCRVVRWLLMFLPRQYIPRWASDFLRTSFCHSLHLTLLGCLALTLPFFCSQNKQLAFSLFSTSSLTALCSLTPVVPVAGRSWIADLPTKSLHLTSTWWIDAAHSASSHSAVFKLLQLVCSWYSLFPRVSQLNDEDPLDLPGSTRSIRHT